MSKEFFEKIKILQKKVLFFFNKIKKKYLELLDFFSSPDLKDTKYKNALIPRKVTACVLDSLILSFLRFGILILYIRFLNGYTSVFTTFQQDFISKTGISNVSKFLFEDIEHVKILVNSALFINILLILFVMLFIGVFYDMIMLSSKDCSTIGRKALKIKVLDAKKLEKLSIFRIFIYSFLSLMPFVFIPIALILAYTANYTLVFISLFLIIGFWHESILGSRRRSLHEILSGSITVIEKK